MTIKDLNIKGSKLLTEQKYIEAVHVFNEILKIETHNIYACYGKLFCLYRLQELTDNIEDKKQYIDNAKTLAEYVLSEREGKYKYASVSKEELFEMANFCIVKQILLNAKNKHDLEQAIPYTRNFHLFSPDYGPTLRAELFLKLNRMDLFFKIAYEYEKSYVFTKTDLSNYEKNIDIDPEKPLIKDLFYFSINDPNLPNYVANTTYSPIFMNIKDTPEYKKWEEEFTQKYLNYHENETAYEALIRLQEYLKTYNSNHYYDIGESIHFSEPISVEEIEDIEKKLNISFSSSYKKFITTYGLMSIKQPYGSVYNMFFSYEEIKAAREYFKEFCITEEELDIINDIIPFQKGWKDGKYDDLFFFNTKLENPQGEMAVKAWGNNGDIPGGQKVNGIYASYLKTDLIVTFDQHMSILVTDLIRSANLID